MEMENRYASNAKGNLGVTLGAIGTGLGVLGGGLGNGLGGILGGGWNYNNHGYAYCGDSTCVNRYEAGMQARIAELETEVKLRDANAFTMSEMGKLRDYVEHRFDRVEHEICDQKAFNAAQISNISCIQGQLAQLYSLTKLVVPNSAVCPGWGDVTITPATAAAAG